MRTALVLAAILLAGCTHPSKVRAIVDIESKPPDLTAITLRIKNQEMQPTVMLRVNVSVQLRRGDSWGKASPVIHPPALVLNRQEEQIIRATVKLNGEAIRATVTVREDKSGKLVTSEEFEKILAADSHNRGQVFPLLTLRLGNRRISNISLERIHAFADRLTIMARPHQAFIRELHQIRRGRII